MLSHRQFRMSHTLRADTLYSEIVQNVHDNPRLRHKHFLFPAHVFNKAILFQAKFSYVTKHMLWKTTYNRVISFCCMKEKKGIPSVYLADGFEIELIITELVSTNSYVCPKLSLLRDLPAIFFHLRYPSCLLSL